MELVLLVERAEESRSSLLLYNGKGVSDDHNSAYGGDRLTVTARSSDDEGCGLFPGRLARRSCLYLKAWMFDRSCKTVLDVQPQLYWSGVYTAEL